jgi:hypothetical protein
MLKQITNVTAVTYWHAAAHGPLLTDSTKADAFGLCSGPSAGSSCLNTNIWDAKNATLGGVEPSIFSSGG